jgi:hypothetical protein
LSSERRDRFLKLERPRQAGGNVPEPLPDEERFESIGEPVARRDPTATPGVPSTSTDRFRPPPERPLETAEHREGVQPFTRCASCQVDNTVYAATCQNCGVALDTQAQRDFNERLWASRKAEAEAEQRATAAQDRQRRELAEEMARQEKDRIDEQYGDATTWRSGGVSDTAGMRLLRLVPGAGWRVALAVVAVGIPLLLLLFGRGSIQFAGLALLGLLIALFSPARRRSGRW